MGESDWSSKTITVFLRADGLPTAQTVLVDALSNHLAVLCEHLFLSTKPPRPTQSRWTGVPAVSQWALSLELFHRMLGPMLQSLAGNDDSASASGAAADFSGPTPTLDNDARTSNAASRQCRMPHANVTV